MGLDLKFSVSVKCGPLSLVGNFLELIGMELGHTSKR
jgi:hypothetical protein